MMPPVLEALCACLSLRWDKLNIALENITLENITLENITLEYKTRE